MIRFDHIAIAVHRLTDVTPFLVGMLGGEPAQGSPSRFYNFAQWRYAGGGRLEVLEPRGEPDGFLHRFIAQHGPRVHHVTFRVPDIRETCTRAESHGYKIVGFDDSYPTWKEAFLHPRQALGIVVQMAQMSRPPEGTPKRPWEPPAAPPNPPPAVTMRGLRLRAQSIERADLQWGQVLQGTRSENDRGEPVYRWDRSALSLTIEIDPGAEEGPVAIEFETDRAIDVPAGPHPVLGAVFKTVPPLAR
jgi:methylmalonyl-CoA/ethylmalonyl-CoA epimerase